MKRFVLIVLIVLVAISFCGCGPLLPYGRNHEIFFRAGTDWISEDETMSIHVNDDGSATLIMKSDGEECELLLLSLYNMIQGYNDYSIQEGVFYLSDQSEEWRAFYHRKWFRIKVLRSKFFEKGTRIRFNIVEEASEGNNGY